MQTENEDGQITLFDLAYSHGKMCPEPSHQDLQAERTFASSWRKSAALRAIPYQSLDLTPGSGNLLDESFWEILSPLRGGCWTLNTGASPKEERESSLSQILQADAPLKYYLSRRGCRGILRRARVRGKPLPKQLEQALKMQAGISPGNRPKSNVYPLAFTENQRSEVRDLHEKVGTLCAYQGTKQRTYIAAFNAGAGAKAGTVSYAEERAPTLKAVSSGNQMPSVLCLNDQGGRNMDCTEELSGTLRAQEHGYQPVVYENHGIDARYTGPLSVVPTLSAGYGTGGNNVPLVASDNEPTYCIIGNAIDRQPHNGGSGIGYQENIAYTLTTSDIHAVFTQQGFGNFKPTDVAGTECARQYKSSTDLVCQSGEACCAVNNDESLPAAYLIRRLTPLECELLQGFPAAWTELPDASDSARYKALGNSVAIPCVEYVLHGIALVMQNQKQIEREVI